jgi:hypothetical protein
MDVNLKKAKLEKEMLVSHTLKLERALQAIISGVSVTIAN